MQNVEKTCRTCGRTFRSGETFCPEDGGRLATRSASLEAGGEDPLIGAVLDSRYRVRRVVGEGGMGIVYEAAHELIDRRVALKVLRDDFSRRPDVVERFRREAKSASRIGHPNIVDVLDFGETPTGASYFVMEMLEGEDVADALVRGGSLPPERIVPILVQCCRALAAAHDKGIIHRDLKPENIFLIERDGAPDFVKIVDFGVAKMNELELGPRGEGPRKLTRTGMIFGTPEYMSPEQAQGQPPDHRVDVYALGVILFELLTGRVPFEGESFMSVLSKHARNAVPRLRDVSPRLGVSRELEGIVYRALEKAPGARFATMGEMAGALMAVPEMAGVVFRTSGSGQLAAPALTAPSSGRPELQTHEIPTTELLTPLTTDLPPVEKLPVARRPVRRAGVAALVLSVIAAVFVWLGQDTEPLPPAAASDAPAAPLPPAVEPGSAEVVIPESEPEPAAEALDLVTVAVTTRPSGAHVQLEGGAALCDQTPCSFETRRGESLSLVARSGARRARTRVEPAADIQVHLVLLAPRAGEAAEGEPAVKAARRPVTRDRRGDLKVPAAFR